MGISKWNQPWYTCWYNAFRRCNNPKNNRYQYYGAKGVKFEITFWEMGYLWLRDEASKMKKPQIHREDDSKNYCVGNCSFIEASEHSKITHIGRKRSKESRQRMSNSGGTMYGENHGCSKLSNKDVKSIRFLLDNYFTGKEIAKCFNVSRSLISAIKTGVLRKKA